MDYPLVNPNDILAIRIYFKEGRMVDVYADRYEINRIVDELIILDQGLIKARFNISAIAGYAIIREKED